VAAACSGTVNKKTVRPPVSYTLLEIKKDCAMCRLPPRTEKVGELKKKRSALCLDCNRHRTAPAELKVDIVPAMEFKG
jgi:hypothetical protein